jgi:hydroxyacylglutathione hydrolase
MQVDCLSLGAFGTNCYCVRATAEQTDCAILDPGLGSEVLVRFLRQRNLHPQMVILTHGHIDHIAGVELLRQNWPGIPVAVHRTDAPMLGDAEANLSLIFVEPYQTRADRLLEEGDVVETVGLRFRIIHIPGHTPGGICLYCPEEKTVFVGDTLMAGSVGRADFPGGDFGQLIAGIRDKLLTLPPETIVYSGHGPETTIGVEAADNPYLG